ncbi:MAG: hypothetical protein LBT83_06370 [Tannerella sp.]|jgi:hypothetical protein|nr:hypothetical protein [Tannerella sp.]
MAHRNDWIKQNHSEFYTQVNKTEDYINDPQTEKLNDFGYDVGSKIYNWIMMQFLSALNTFNAAYAAWFDADLRTRIAQIDLDESERRLKRLYRQLYGLLKGNPLVTGHDLMMMGMPLRPSGGRKPSPAPVTLVEAEFELRPPEVIWIHYRDAGATDKAKPAGMHGVEAVYRVSDVPVTDPEELIHSVFETRTPLKMVFDSKDRGRRLYIAFRWENTAGRKGDRSEIYEAIIP